MRIGTRRRPERRCFEHRSDEAGFTAPLTVAAGDRRRQRERAGPPEHPVPRMVSPITAYPSARRSRASASAPWACDAIVDVTPLPAP